MCYFYRNLAALFMALTFFHSHFPIEIRCWSSISGNLAGQVLQFGCQDLHQGVASLINCRKSRKNDFIMTQHLCITKDPSHLGSSSSSFLSVLFNLSKLTITLSKLGEGGIQDSQVFSIKCCHIFYSMTMTMTSNIITYLLPDLLADGRDL